MAYLSNLGGMFLSAWGRTMEGCDTRSLKGNTPKEYA